MEHGQIKEGYEICYANGIKVKHDGIYYHLTPNIESERLKIDVWRDGEAMFIHRNKEIKVSEAMSTLHFLELDDKTLVSLLNKEQQVKSV